MSALTDEFAAVIGELADELGEGLTATLIKFPTSAAFDPATQSYSDEAAVEQIFACAPPAQAKRNASNADLTQTGNLMIIVPAVDEDGDAMAPVVGDRIKVGTVIYHIVAMVPLMVGTGTSGYQCEVRP